jgi:glutathione S-transferase
VFRMADVASSVVSTLVRLGSGVSVATLGARPAQPLEIYEFEGCPFCRKVREALTVLDLEAKVLPCPKGGRRFRPALVERAGKEQFPYLVDPNTGKEMYESNDIVRYLFEQYGDGRVPGLLAAGPLTDATSALAGVPRLASSGIRSEPSRAPEQPLELYSYESSPFCRIVREKLCSLELSYVLHNVGRGSPRRPAFVARSGKMQVPYLVDPNTGTEMFESADITAYLGETYAR